MLVLLYILLAAVSLLLIGVVLIQDSKTGGLTAAFSGVGQDVSGAGGQREITRFTAGLATVFLVLCLAVGLMKTGSDGRTIANDEVDNPNSVENPDGAPGSGAPGSGVTNPADPPKSDGDSKPADPPKDGDSKPEDTPEDKPAGDTPAPEGGDGG